MVVFIELFEGIKQRVGGFAIDCIATFRTVDEDDANSVNCLDKHFIFGAVSRHHCSYAKFRANQYQFGKTLAANQFS